MTIFYAVLIVFVGKMKVFVFICLSMDLYDYYKLLSIPFGSDISIIQKAYVLKIHEYQSSNYSEIERESLVNVLNTGYEILSNPGLKTQYDNALKELYLKKGNAGSELQLYKKYGLSGKNPLRMDVPKTPKPDIDFADLEKKVTKGKWLVPTALIVLAALLLFADWLYFLPNSAFKMLTTFFLGIIYLLFMIAFISKFSKYIFALAVIKKWRQSAERWLIALFLVMSFAIPTLFFRFQKVRIDYELKNYGVRIPVKRFALDGTSIVLEYAWKGKHYEQSIYLGEDTEEIKKSGALKGQVFVICSSRKPEIVRLDSEMQ